MGAIDTMTLADIVQIISGLGVTGVLIVGIWMFIKGKILPRDVVDEILRHSDSQTKLLAEELRRGFVQSVEKAAEAGAKEGVIAGLEHVNGGKA